jgi:large subunit ribosomal protein L30
MTQGRTVKVTLTGSTIGRPPRQRQTLRGLGLTRIGKTVSLPDNGPTRGMIRKVSHMVRMES